MRKTLLALLLAFTGVAQAQVQLRDGYPQRYTVVRGDTLWDISGKFLREPWKWPEIWHANPQIANPDLIYPGDTLTLQFVDGQPRLVVERGASRGTGLFRQGKVYTDPQTKEFLGINADDIGTGELVATEGDVGTLTLRRTTEEVRLGDRLFVSEERPITSTFMPSAPQAPVNGVIIDVPRGVTQIGVMDVVTIDKGRRDGLAEGNVLAVFKTGETVRDRVTGQQVKIPDERSGLLMVFRTYEKLSYGLVLNATRSLAVQDKVRNP